MAAAAAAVVVGDVPVSVFICAQGKKPENDSSLAFGLRLGDGRLVIV